MKFISFIVKYLIFVLNLIKYRLKRICQSVHSVLLTFYTAFPASRLQALSFSHKHFVAFAQCLRLGLDHCDTNVNILK